jgi:hypothetical protein
MFAAIYIFLLKNIQIPVKNEKSPVLCQMLKTGKKNQEQQTPERFLYPD